MADYPTLTILPSYPLDEEEEDVTIRSEMEAGYTHTRKRYTKERLTFTVKYDIMPTADKNTLKTFVNTVEQGATSFNWTHPVSSTVYEVKFIELPKFSHIVAGYWSVEFKIREC